jgi:hypothetical protein
MDGVGTRVVRLLGDLFRLDHFDDLWFPRVRLGIEDVDAGGAQARNHEIAPLGMCMGCVRT